MCDVRSEDQVIDEAKDHRAPRPAGNYAWALGVAAGLILADRFSKVWAWSELADGSIIVIDPWLSFELAENRGAAFGLFQDGGRVLAVFAAVAVVIILVALRSVVHRSEVIGLGMIMAGAVGNLIDRIVRGTGLVDGAVIDWIKFPNFPNFNIADSSITVGVTVLLLVSLFRRE